MVQRSAEHRLQSGSLPAVRWAYRLGSARIDSGLPLGPPRPFKVKSTKPGVYHYFCDVHYGMQGTVVVLPKSKHIPTAKQDTKT